MFSTTTTFWLVHPFLSLWTLLTCAIVCAALKALKIIKKSLEKVVVTRLFCEHISSLLCRVADLIALRILQLEKKVLKSSNDPTNPENQKCLLSPKFRWFNLSLLLFLPHPLLPTTLLSHQLPLPRPHPSMWANLIPLSRRLCSSKYST